MSAHRIRSHVLLPLLGLVCWALLAAGPAAAAAPDGSLISVGPHIYRVVGGAPLHITRCDYSNGCAGVQAVPNLDGYRAYPRDGAMVANVDDGGTYRFAGGSAQWISSCDYGGGCPGVSTVDGGTFAELDHMRQYPADGTMVSNRADGGTYRFAGGAPLWISSCDYGPGCPGVVPLDGGTFAQAGSLNPAQPHMRQFPADGTLVANFDAGTVHRIAGGAPLWLPSCEDAGCAAAVQVDQNTFGRLGTITVGQPHLRSVPADGTYLEVGATERHRVAGGAALPVTDCAVLDGACQGAVRVPSGTLAQPDRSHLRAVPQDGTRMKGLPSGALWIMRDGKAVADSGGGAPVGLNDATIERLRTAAPPPPPPSRPGTAARIKALVLFSYVWRGRRLVFSDIVVKNIPLGARLTARCTRKPCGGRRYTKIAKRRTVALKPFVGRPMRRGTVLEIRVTKPGRTGAVKRLSIRRKGAPSLTTRCLPDGGRRPARC